MQSTDGGWHLHSKNGVNTTVLHMRDVTLLLLCQYTHGVVHWHLGPHDTLLCVLIVLQKTEKCMKNVTIENIYNYVSSS